MKTIGIQISFNVLLQRQCEQDGKVPYQGLTPRYAGHACVYVCVGWGIQILGITDLCTYSFALCAIRVFFFCSRLRQYC